MPGPHILHEHLHENLNRSVYHLSQSGQSALRTLVTKLWRLSFIGICVDINKLNLCSNLIHNHDFKKKNRTIEHPVNARGPFLGSIGPYPLKSESIGISYVPIGAVCSENIGNKVTDSF